MTSISNLSTWQALSFADRIRSLESIAADPRSSAWERQFSHDIRSKVLAGASLTLLQIHKVDDIVRRASLRRMAPDRARVSHLAGKIHRQGPQPLAYLFQELGAQADIVPLLERYAALPADFIRELGGDRISRGFVVIEGGRHE